MKRVIKKEKKIEEGDLFKKSAKCMDVWMKLNGKIVQMYTSQEGVRRVIGNVLDILDEMKILEEKKSWTKKYIRRYQTLVKVSSRYTSVRKM